MKCEHIRELLSAYVDNMTDAKENRIIAAHLAECEACRHEYDNLQLMCTILGNMGQPELPERFTEEFHKRLLEEKTRLFSAKEFRRPRKSGWVAAGLAAIALTIGIYVSSIIPIGAWIANFDEKPAEKERNNIAIEDIIRSIKGWGTDNNEVVNEVKIADSQKKSPTKIDDEITSNENNAGEKVVDEEPLPVVPKYIEDYATKIKVKDMEEATDQIVQIAAANNLEYKALPYASNAQALSANKSKEVNIKVDKNKSQSLIKQLNNIGQAASPVQNKLEITNEYAQVEEQIYITKKLINKLEGKNELSANEAADLVELKKHLEESYTKKTELDKEVNTVIVRVILEEDVSH